MFGTFLAPFKKFPYLFPIGEVQSAVLRVRPGGARFQQVQALNAPGRRRDIAEGRGVTRFHEKKIFIKS